MAIKVTRKQAANQIAFALMDRLDELTVRWQVFPKTFLVRQWRGTEKRQLCCINEKKQGNEVIFQAQHNSEYVAERSK